MFQHWGAILSEFENKGILARHDKLGITKWEVGAYARTTQLIRGKDVLFYYEKTTCFSLHWPSSVFLPIKGVYIFEWGELMKRSLCIKSLILCCSA